MIFEKNPHPIFEDLCIFQCLIFPLHQTQSILTVKKCERGKKFECIYYTWTHHWAVANDLADLFGVTKAGLDMYTQPPLPLV